MKVSAFLKLAKMVESDIQRFAMVAQDLWEEKKRPGKVSRLHRQRMDGITVISQQQALKSQRGGQAYSQAVSHGVSLFYSVLCFQVFSLTFACNKTKPKPNKKLYFTFCHY